MLILDIYKRLKKQYPHVDHNWWPVSGTFEPEKFEIVVSTVLTQNTNWKNVERALKNLIESGLLSASAIANCHTSKLQRIIRPAGFYRQKAKRLRDFCRFVADFQGDFYKDVSREQLLAINGIGRETADSILLYACNRPFFVIDAYTRRLLMREGVIEGKEKYDDIRNMFESKLPKDTDLYKEFHALVVENEKYLRKLTKK